MRGALAFLVVSLVLGGCLGATPAGREAAAAPSLDDLVAGHASATADHADGTRSFAWEGVSTAGASALFVKTGGDTAPALVDTFQVDGRVGYVEANISYQDPVGGSLLATIRDAQGRVACSADSYVDPPTCNVPVPPGLTSKVAWTIAVQSGFEAGAAGPPNVPFRVTVTLHRPAEIARGDAMAGVDRGIAFRVSDTGATGGEANVGLLGDGTIFAQEGLQTMRSRDQGATWQDVAPAATRAETFDPALAVDPWRGAVYVDQLYVGCSALAWSRDAGGSWTTNPAACGLPADDHPKLAAGPSDVPGSPFPVVYYGFTSFAGGAWVSRSLDGGLTWQPAPVAGVGDGRTLSDAGPVFADEHADVYDPIYLCDNGGSVGVGVSHDYGLSYSFVVVDKRPGQCSDVDPGLSVDAAGNVYLAYHRADGVSYAYSKDHGATWSAPVRVSLPSERSFVHVASVAGDAGRLAVVWRATSDSAKGSDDADGWSAWHLYVAFVENATAPDPGVKVGHVGPPDDIQQRGPVCMAGFTCSGGARNLGDFIGAAVEPDGRVVVAYADGCPATCDTPADSRAQLGLVAIEDQGPRLFADKAPWAGR